MSFDWLDTVLVSLGFVALVLLAMTLSEVAGFDLATVPGRQAMFLVVLAPSLLRRAIFGLPRAIQVRTGPLASLLSIGALLTSFAGVGFLALGSSLLVGALASAPDFLAEAREERDRIEASMPEISIHMSPPGETRDQRDARLALKAAEDLRRAATLLEDLAADAEARWQQQQRRGRNNGGLLFGFGLLLVAAGAALERARRSPR